MAALFAAGAFWHAASAQDKQFVPGLVYRTGPYAPSGIPFANGFADYFKMINSATAASTASRSTIEECDTGYNTDRGVECYERLKGAGRGRPLSTRCRPASPMR